MRFGVIGAGFTGLTAAYRLCSMGHEVEVFEAAPAPGGLAAGFKAPEWEWPLEKFYHHLFESDSAIRSLAAETGFGDKLFFRRPQTTQWWNGRTYPLDSPLAIVRYPGASLGARLRFGAAVAYLRLVCKDWRKLEQTTAVQWCRERLGGAYPALMEPLLKGKFGPYVDEVNMAWLWARFTARTPRLGYFEGGFQAFADGLARRVETGGGRVHLAAPVRSVRRRSDGGWLISAEAGERTFDRVISTTSPGLMARLAPELPGQYLEGLAGLHSMGAIVVTLALSRPLTGGAYWVNVPKPAFPFLALVEHTNFIEAGRYAGQTLVYLGDYIEEGHEYLTMSHEEVLERFLPALTRVNPAFQASWVRGSWVHRERYAQPIVTLNHSSRVPSMRTPLDGLFWASMSHIYPYDRGTNFSVALGEDVAKLAAGK